MYGYDIYLSVADEGLWNGALEASIRTRPADSETASACPASLHPNRIVIRDCFIASGYLGSCLVIIYRRNAQIARTASIL